MKRILLVEDDIACLRTMKLVLQLEGYEVNIASDGDGALLAFHNSSAKFDLVITDVQMPRMSGIEFLSAIVTETCCPKILAMSGFFDQQTVGSLQANGCTNYLKKPFNDQELLGVVSELLK